MITIRRNSREIRVFISSTFRDMNAERDYLNNIIFPQVIQYCKKRFITFIPIDLRWGITEEDSRNGMVLSACMEQIDNSRPFFIGILGSRYGWNPKLSELNGMRINEEQQEWVKNMASDGASITEMEMEYGVLREMNIPYASFFIRSDKVNIPHEFREEKGSIAEKRLKKLKHRIKSQQKYPVIEYESIQHFGEIIRKQLIKMIELEYPLCSNDETVAMIEQQELTLESRAKTLFDLSQTIAHFDRWISERRRFLLITGEPDSGTSTVLANCVLALRNRCSNPVIYFDFEAIDKAINPIDALLKYLSIEELRIPDDQWGMIAIDNTSILSTEDEKRFIRWMKGLTRNIVVAMTATYDSNLVNRVRYDFACPEINMHNLPIELKRKFIDNYMQQFGKRLSPQQLDTLSKQSKSASIGHIELLLQLIVNFGSFEQLDERINSLVKSFDGYWIFHQIQEDAITSYTEIGMEMLYSRTLICISLVRNGIPEEDLWKVAGLTQAEWSVISPSILLLCKGNANNIRFSNYSDWSADTIHKCSTSDRSFWGLKMINWYLSTPEKWSYCARIVNDIFQEIWYLPFYPESKYNELEETIFSFAKSPDMVAQLNDSDLANLWGHLNNKLMSDTASQVYGRTVEELEFDEANTYYMRLAKAAKSLKKGKDAAYCYLEISKIKERAGMSDADFFRYRNAIEIGCPDMAIFFINESGILQGERRGWLTGKIKATYTLKQQLRAHLVLFEAHVLRGDWRNAERVYSDFMAVAEDLIRTATGELKEILVTGYSTFAYAMSGCYPMNNRTLAKKLFQVVCTNTMQLGLDHEATYLMFMAGTCIEYHAKSYNNMQKYALWALHSASVTYGRNSYQYARAELLYAYANYRLTGNYGINRGPYANVYAALDYSRSYENKLQRNIEWCKIEIGVRKSLLQEFEFFWNIERSIQPTTYAQDNLEKSLKEYKKSIGVEGIV